MIEKTNDKFEKFIPKIFGIFLFVILLLAYSQILAIGSPYTPGATLDPACSPGSLNCFVQMFPDQTSNSGKYLVTNGSNLSWSTVNQSQWASSGLDISYVTGNVGIGTSSPTTPLDVNGEIRAKNLTITGDNITVDAPTNISAMQTQVCTDGCGFFADGFEHNYRIYSYKVVGPQTIYSSSYITLSSNLVDDGSQDVYDITVSWDPAIGADGYRILKYYNALGYNFNVGYDTTSTSFIDDGCVDVCFNGGMTGVTPTSSNYTNTATINGILALTGPIMMQGQVVRIDTDSNFVIGSDITITGTSNFIAGAGNAGPAITSATGSNFIGDSAGRDATGVDYSNFFGAVAGYQSVNAGNSNFFGLHSGQNSIDSSRSNFFGESSGQSAVGASRSNFFGEEAGFATSNASYSTLIGFKAGSNPSYHNSIGSNNIIIGTNISLPAGTTNAINLGGVLFGTGTYSNTSTIFGVTPAITPVSGGRIGIGVVNPAYTLQVGNSSVSGIVARFQNSSGTCDINPTSASLSCSSDETLKKNITPVVPGILGKVLLLNPVTYNWNSELDTDHSHTGFIAQQVEAIFPDLIATDSTTGLKSLNYVGLAPYTIKAIQELNLKVEDLSSLDISKLNSLGFLVKQFLADQSLIFKEATIGILHINDQVCVDDVCATKEEFKALLLQAKNLPQTSSSNSSTQDTPVDTQNQSDTSSSNQDMNDAQPTVDSANVSPEPVQ